MKAGDRDPLVDVETFEREGGNVIVGTPGRISDVMQRSALLDTRQLEVPVSHILQILKEPLPMMWYAVMPIE